MQFLRSPLLPRFGSRGLRFVAALFLAWMAVVPAGAQFNGPALTIPYTGTSNPTAVTTDQSVLYPAAADFELNSGDLISVRVFGPGDYNTSVRLSSDGKVQLPLIGVVSLQNLTVLAAENLIGERLVAAGMFRNPEIIIQVLEAPGSNVSVIGELHGVFPIVGHRRLLEVLAAAGGLPATASHVITINRAGTKEPITVDLGTDPAQSASANIPVLPGDIVIISRIGAVYILGGFKQQGLVPITGNSPLTLLQVTALSGGPDKDARYDDLRIIRTVDNKRTFVKLNITRVMNGKDPDPILQANDILYMPPSTIKTIIDGGTLNLFFSTVSFFLTVLTYTRVN